MINKGSHPTVVFGQPFYSVFHSGIMTLFPETSLMEFIVKLSLSLNLSLSQRDRDRADTIITCHTTPLQTF